MLNLLNIIFVIFYGYYGEGARYINYDYQASPQITYVDNVNDDNFSVDLIIDTNYYLSIQSSDFEIDTGYDVESVYTSNLTFTLDDTTSYMFDNLTLYVEYFDFELYYGVKNNLSFIHIFYYEYIELGLTLIDGTYIDEFREIQKEVHIDTNFTIYDNFEVYDYTNFHIQFDYDFVGTYQEGYDVGYEDGYDNGFRNGEEYGYEQGSNDLDNVFNGSWVEWLGNAITGFFALEIFPGFSLAGALGAVLCAYIMMWILKVLAGG